MSENNIIENFVLTLRKELNDPSIKISRDHFLSITFREEFEVVIKFSPEQQIMYLFSPIRSMSDLNRQQGFTLIANCMEANHLFQSTRCACMSFWGAENIIALNYSYPTHKADAMELIDILAAFGETALTLGI